MKSLTLIMFTMLFSMGLFSFKVVQEKWVVPAKYEKMKNPTTSSAENVAEGKALYAKHCASCHGKKGLGMVQRQKKLKEILEIFQVLNSGHNQKVLSFTRAI